LEDLTVEGTGVDQHITDESSFEQKGDDFEGGKYFSPRAKIELRVLIDDLSRSQRGSRIMTCRGWLLYLVYNRRG
jgi:hypothetical protein